METIDLSSAEYWESDANDIRLNPALKIDLSGLSQSLKDREIRSSIILATSGTSGQPRLVILSKQAMLHSAEAVNQWCGLTSDDIWLGGLSTFHVGGLGIFCRAHLAGSRVYPMAWNQWTRDGSTLLESIKDATLTSLTPVHLFDLVEAGVRSPESIRGVFLGGGALSAKLTERARALGWPLWPTYGMTEACSQIATSLDGDSEWLPVMPHWETQVSETGRLTIKGDALMSGYLSFGEDSTWLWHDATDQEGFYTTGDLVEIRERRLKPLGRADDLVKILGELVSISKIENALCQHLGVRAVIFDRPDQRRGANLTAMIETDRDLTKTFRDWNDSLPPFEKIGEVKFVKVFPEPKQGKLTGKSFNSSNQMKAKIEIKILAT